MWPRVLPADHRLRDSESFRRTVRRGRKAGGAALVVHMLMAEAGPARVGFVVGRPVGNAVVRNRVRRRLRELVRQDLTRLPEGSTLVVRALPPASGLASAELRAELVRCLDRVLAGSPATAARAGAVAGAQR